MRRAAALASGKCRLCGNRVCLRVDGTVRCHGVAVAGGWFQYRRCAGTYLLPVDDSRVALPAAMEGKV